MELIENYLMKLLIISPILVMILILAKARRDKYFFKRCLQVLLIIIVFSGLLRFNFYSLSPSRLLYRMNFYLQNGRMMNDEENIMYGKFDDPLLVDSEYCSEIKGQWTYGRYHNMPCENTSSGSYCFNYCMPPTSDAGKICYDDSECESYCDVESADATHDTCFPYKAKRDECGGYFYFEKGKIKRSPPIWC